MTAYDYDKITKYAITAVCEEPLHIGSAEGDSTEVLIHPVDGRPFIQASSLAGVMREWYSKVDFAKCEEMFGHSHFQENENASEFQSRVRFTDASFDDPVRIERRPHVSIDPSTGTVKSSKGSGQKFDIEYVGAGSAFSFDAYLYEASDVEDLSAQFEKILSALNAGELQFGAKKSNGGGRVSLQKVEKDVYHLQDDGERRAWIGEEKCNHFADYLSQLPEYTPSNIVYRVSLTGRTSGALQVKGLAVSKFGKDAPDSENIRDARGEYIVPGSSLKGVLRSRMQMIAGYKKCPELIGECFGTANEADGSGQTGNLFFSDAVIGTKEQNDTTEKRNRIHIDKFTGGVMNQALFSEKNAFGDITFSIDVKQKYDTDAAAGILLYALRDLAAGLVNIGNGYSTGKGFIDTTEIRITRMSDKKEAVLHWQEKKTEDQDGIIRTVLQAVEKRQKKAANQDGIIRTAQQAAERGSR